VKLETKTVAAKVTKAKADGTATALVSVFGNVDLGGDRVLPGAFTRSLEEWQAKGDPIPVIWSHDWDNPESFVGWADPAEIRETDAGLEVPMKFDLDRPRAEQVHHLLKTRRVTQFSFGYFVRAYQDVEDADYGTVRELADVDLFEVGPTLLGMNPETELLQAASALRGLRDSRVLSAKAETIREAYEALGSVLESLPQIETPKTAPQAKAVEVPSYVSENAARGLALYEEGHGGDGLVEQTIRDARDMVAGEIRDEKVRLMGPWIARHIVDLDAPQNSDPDADGYPGPGLVAMLLWGAGPNAEGARRTQEWAEQTAARLEEEGTASRLERMGEKATAEEAVEGAFVGWVDGDDAYVGRIEHVMTEGMLGVEGSPNAIEATPEDPAILVRIFDDGLETEELRGARASDVEVVPDPRQPAPEGASATTDSPADAGDTQGTIPSEHILALLTRPRNTEE
jgi:HK97 family phage prohead protease